MVHRRKYASQTQRKISSFGLYKKEKKRITFKMDAAKITNRLFSLQRNKKINSKPFNEKRQELGIYRKQIYKPSGQFSVLCSTTFMSYLLKRFTQFKRVLYENAMLVDQNSPPISALLKHVSRVNFFRFVCPIFNETKTFLTTQIHN